MDRTSIITDRTGAEEWGQDIIGVGQDGSTGRQDLVSKLECGKGTGREVDIVRSKICGQRRNHTGHYT